MFYVDTSIWISAVKKEAKSEDVRSWLDELGSKILVISDWVVAEFSSALSLKIKTGQISIEQRAIALGAFSTAIHDSVNVLPVKSSHFRSAAVRSQSSDRPARERCPSSGSGGGPRRRRLHARQDHDHLGRNVGNRNIRTLTPTPAPPRPRPAPPASPRPPAARFGSAPAAPPRPRQPPRASAL